MSEKKLTKISELFHTPNISALEATVETELSQTYQTRECCLVIPLFVLGISGNGCKMDGIMDG